MLNTSQTSKQTFVMCLSLGIYDPKLVFHIFFSCWLEAHGCLAHYDTCNQWIDEKWIVYCFNAPVCLP